MTGNYSNTANALNSLQTRYKQVNDHIGELQTQLTVTQEKIDECQSKIDVGSRDVTDTTPLQGIKNAITTIRTEIKEMELRSGVLSHSLFQAKLREKSKAVS
jgi:estrogen-related receptor beta like 1